MAPPELRKNENKNKKRNLIKYKRNAKDNGKNNVENGKTVSQDNLNNNLIKNTALSNGNSLHIEVMIPFHLYLNINILS